MRVLRSSLPAFALLLTVVAPAFGQPSYSEDMLGSVHARLRWIREEGASLSAPARSEALAEAERIAREDLASFPGDRASAYQAMAWYCGNVGDLPSAARFHQEAERALEGLYPVFPDVAVDVLLGRSTEELIHERPDAAREALIEATRIVETTFGRRSRSPILLIRHLAERHRGYGSRAAAERLDALADEIARTADQGDERIAYREDRWGAFRGLQQLPDERPREEITRDLEAIAEVDFAHFPRDRILALVGLATYELTGPDADTAGDVLNRAWSVLEPLREHLPEAEVRYRIAEATWRTRLGEIQRAGLLLSEADTVRAATFSDESLATIEVLMTLAQHLDRAESSERARDLADRAAVLSARLSGPESPLTVGAWVASAWSRLRTGDSAGALEQSSKALAAVESWTQESVVRPYPGRTWSPEDEEHYERLYREQKASEELHILFQLSMIHRALGDTARYREAEDRAERLSREVFGTGSPAHLRALRNIAIGASDDPQRLEAANARYRDALAVSDQKDEFLVVSFDLSLAQQYEDAGDFDRALEHLAAAEERSDSLGAPWSVAVDRARVELAAGRIEAAQLGLPSVETALGEIEESTRSTPSSSFAFLHHESDNATLGGILAFLVDLAGSEAIGTADRERVLDLAGRAAQLKSLRSLGAAAVPAGRGGSQDDVQGEWLEKLEEYRGLQALIRATEEELATRLGGDPAESEEIRLQLSASLDRAATLRTELDGALRVASPVTLASVQAALGRDEAVVLFQMHEFPVGVRSRRSGHVLWLLPDRFELLPVCAEADGCDLQKLRRWVDELRAQLSPAGRGAVPVGEEEAPSFDPEMSDRVSESLWAPLERAFTDSPPKRIFLIVDDPLHGLPFAALRTPCATRREGACWLAERYDLAYLPSLSAFVDLRSANPTRGEGGFIGFGDPVFEGDEMPSVEAVRAARTLTRGGGIRGTFARLEETADEVCEAARVFSEAHGEPVSSCAALADGAGHRFARVFLRDAASEAAVHRLDREGVLRGAEILAFATHGVVSGETGGEPGLLLSVGGGEGADDDGFLSATEVAQLDLGAELVVLSACSTASSSRMGARPRELPTMTWAFFGAGARAVLANHVDVESAAAADVVTEVLTRSVAEGLSPSTALAEAIRRRIEAGRPPTYWAPFAFYGTD